MKICLDPIPTNKPWRCASFSKMKKIASYLLEHYDDVFIYWLYPETADLTNEFFPQSDRIRYIPYPHATHDRVLEYYRIDREYYRLLSFQGELWDVDILITNRTSLVPIIKCCMNPPTSSYNWAKKVFLIEDMPMMTFKDHVPISFGLLNDLQSLMGYVSADLTAISAFWEKKHIKDTARKYLSPALITNIETTMIESSPVVVDKCEQKKKAAIMPMLKGDRPFTVGFIGRMTWGNNPNAVFDVMTKHWVFAGSKNRKMKFVISSQSLNTAAVKVPDFVEFNSLDRDEFWKLVRTTMDVYVFMSVEEDYSMSLMEPLILGCPAVLIRKYWSVPTVGEEYPFFVDNVKDAYAMVLQFYNDYPAMYKKFVNWQKKYFEPLMKKRNEVYVPLLVSGLINTWYDDFQEVKAGMQDKIINHVIGLVIQYTRDVSRTFVFNDLLNYFNDNGWFKSWGSKINKPAEIERCVWAVDRNRYRLILLSLGFKDSGSQPGEMTLPEEVCL